jgi:MFS family permease
VAGSTVLFGVGLVVLALADSVNTFYVAEVVMGLAYGVYSAVDTALVVDVLPDPKKPGKDLGVINIANSLPQSLAPALGLLLLGLGGGDNYPALLWGAGIVAVVGALIVLPIRSVR